MEDLIVHLQLGILPKDNMSHTEYSLIMKKQLLQQDTGLVQYVCLKPIRFGRRTKGNNDLNCFFQLPICTADIFFKNKHEKLTSEKEDILFKMDQLTVNGIKHNAIFFHLPEEPYGFLSNWYPACFTLDGMTFSSTEQYIMYRKCMLFDDRLSAASVLETQDPAEQPDLGQTASGFISKVWDGTKQTIAYKGLLAKFTQNEDLKEMLLATEDAYLVECARKDKIWACGIRLHEEERFDMSKWKGQNLLGFALMDVRYAIHMKNI